MMTMIITTINLYNWSFSSISNIW